MGAEVKRSSILAGMALAWLGMSVQAQVHSTGFIVVAPAGEVRFYLSRPLRSDVPLWSQWRNESGQMVCCRRFKRSQLSRQAERSHEPAGALRFEMTLSSGQEPAYYVSRQGGGPAPATPFVGLAMAAPAVHASGSHELRASTGQRVRSCFGVEGLNLLVQQGRRKSTAYLSLGYPIESRHPCTREDEEFIAAGAD